MKGAFHSSQNSRNFGWYITSNGPFRFGPTAIFLTSFKGGPLWPVWSFRSVGPKCPFPFDKIVVPRIALLYPTYKTNNQTRGGLGRVCATRMYRSIGQVKFPKFQIGIFVEWKAPEIMWCVTCHSNEFLSQFDLLHLLLYRYFDILPHRQFHFPDHFTFLWNCPPTPPRSQNFALSKNYRC